MTNERARPAGRSWLTNFLLGMINLVAVAFGLITLISIPNAILLGALKAGRIVGQAPAQALVFDMWFKVICGIVAICALILSAFIAGFVRSLLRGGMFDRWWMMVFLLGCFVLLFAWIGQVVREVTTALPIGVGENYLIVAFLSLWLLAIGYVVKVPWDELRDRFCSLCDRWPLRHGLPTE
jgi:hypothetical protein